MVEVTVHDVLVRGDERAENQRVILLREKADGRLLPIWVGAPEGNALALHLASESPLRPLTVDLAARLLEATGGSVDRVVIDRLHEKTFFASVVVEAAGRTTEVDARPSDALNLAVRVGAPVFVQQDVLAEAGCSDDNIQAKLRKEEERYLGASKEQADWQSLSAKRVKELYAPPRPT